MASINLPDFSEVAEVILPDGAAASEVIAPDGRTVFSAIPDSVVIQHYATTFTQGDSNWLDDATDDGSQDVALNGDPQSVTASDGSEAIDFDSNDYGLLPMPPELEGSSLNAWTYEVAVQYTSTGQEFIGGVFNSNNGQLWQLNINQDEAGNTEEGNIQFALHDADGNSFQFSFSDNNVNINDGNRHDITAIINDASNNNASLILDGTEKSVATANTQSPDNFSSWDNDMGYAVRNVGGSLSGNADITILAKRWHDSAIVGQTISDYP